MIPRYAILRDDKVIEVAFDDWRFSRSFEESKTRIIKQTNLPTAYVSTVFLGINHQFFDGPPIWFETMIFGGEHDGFQRRYSTIEEARTGHAETVIFARSNAWSVLLFRVRKYFGSSVDENDNGE